MLLIVLSIIYIGITISIFLRKKTIFDAFFYVMAPYYFIIVINNLIMVNFGFRLITDDIILIHTLGMGLFYIGNLLADFLSKKVIKKKEENHKVIIPRLRIIILACVVVIALDLFRMISVYGIKEFLSLGEKIDRSFLASHCQIALVPLSIIMYQEANKSGKKAYLVYVLISFLLIFTTFIKYHVLSYVITLFVITSLTKPEKMVKITLLAGLLIVMFYVGNYAVSFAASNQSAKLTFYLNHFWAYVAGSTININRAKNYLRLIHHKSSILLWLLSMLSKLPLMILSKIVGRNLYFYEFSNMFPLFKVGPDVSNVVSILGEAYIQTDLVGFILFMLLWGGVIQLVVNYMRIRKSVRSYTVGSIFIAYNMLSFFSSFFELSHPWETMAQAFILFYVVADYITIKNNYIEKEGSIK